MTKTIKIDFSDLEPLSSFNASNETTYSPNVGPFSGPEKRFKLAAVELVFDGIYPSGRQILNKLGKTKRTVGKVNLNGDECRWKDEVMSLFKIKPYFGYTKRYHRQAYEDSVTGIDYDYERAPNGMLRRIKK